VVDDAVEDQRERPRRGAAVERASERRLCVGDERVGLVGVHRRWMDMTRRAGTERVWMGNMGASSWRQQAVIVG
jgi:hypothetical protein